MTEDRRPFIVVAFRGNLASGKTTCAKRLREQYPHACTLVPFAGPLKSIAMELLPWRHEQLYGTSEEKAAVDPRFGISGRAFMQNLGKAMRIHLGEDVFIEAAMKHIAHWGPKMGGVFIIDDCRYPNEGIALRGHEDFFPEPVFLIHLDRTDAPPVDVTHESEAVVSEQKHLAHAIIKQPIDSIADAALISLVQIATPIALHNAIKHATRRVV
jgi:hypothetical protein